MVCGGALSGAKGLPVVFIWIFFSRFYLLYGHIAHGHSLVIARFSSRTVIGHAFITYRLLLLFASPYLPGYNRRFCSSRMVTLQGLVPTLLCPASPRTLAAGLSPRHSFALTAVRLGSAGSCGMPSYRTTVLSSRIAVSHLHVSPLHLLPALTPRPPASTISHLPVYFSPFPFTFPSFLPLYSRLYILFGCGRGLHRQFTQKISFHIRYFPFGWICVWLRFLHRSFVLPLVRGFA